MANNYSDKHLIAVVVEVIKDIDDLPTLELRVRIPTIHGVLPRGVADNLLPLAKPLIIPGSTVDTTKFNTNIVGAKLFVLLENGDVNKPLYLGMPAGADDFSQGVTIPYASELIPGLVRVKTVTDEFGTTGYIYTSEPE